MITRPGLERRLLLAYLLTVVFAFVLGADSWLSRGAASASAARSWFQDQTISPAAVPNETCATATVINPAALPFAANDTTDGATNDIDPGLLGCATGTGPDAVYSFTPSTTDRYTIGVTPTGLGFDVSLYVVTDCANPATTCVASSNVSGTSKGESTAPTLNAGTRYFIVVDGSAPNSFGPFHFSIRRGLPANDTCASPTLIEASRLPFTASATTFGAADDLNPGVPCLTSLQSGNGADVVYQFTPADSQNYILTVTPIGEYDASIYIVTNCASLTGCTSADFGGAGVAETLRPNLTAGTTYFIVVDGLGGDAGDFTISLEPSISLAPNPPSGLVATVVSPTEIRLDWVDNSSNELGFRIERSLDGFAFGEIATVGSNVTTFSDTTVFANTTFFYRVLAFNNFGNSAPSNIAGVTTPPPPPPPAPVITVSPNPVEFGSVRTTLTRTLTISNAGGTNLVISAISGPASPFFSIVDRPTLPVTIAPAGSFDLMLRFTPTAAQAFDASFIIASNDPATPFVVVNLTGIGTAAPVPNLDIASVIINFPSGTSSTAVEIRNTGDADLVIASLSVPALPFSVSGRPTFPAVFRPGEGFVLTVAFSPSAPGVYSADMSLVSNDPDQLLTVFRLRGTSTPQDEQFKLKAPTAAIAIAGQSNTFNVIAANGTNTDIRLSATAVAGGVFTDRGNGSGDLVVTPAASATGRLLVTFTARDGQNRLKSVQGAITILAASDSHRAQVIWTPPASGTNPPSAVLANDLSITPLAFAGESIDTQRIEPQQTTGLVGYVIYRSTTPGVAVTLANIVGTALAGQTSFIDNLPVPSSSPQTFYYVVTALYGTGTDSATSNETSTAPRMINLEFRGKALRMLAANSNIAVGAVLIVDGTQTYVPTRNGDRIVVEKKSLSTPGGLKPAKIFKSGSSHTVQIRNPNGATSALQLLGTIPTGGVKEHEWHVYGGDRGSKKYSPLDQINRDNVQKLKVAWTWNSPDLKIIEQNSQLFTFGYEATPLMIGGVLYISTSLSQVAAIDAQTGKTIWVHDPKSYVTGHPTNLGFVHRGVAHWTDGKVERIFIGTSDAYLVALDAKTGQPVPGFGDGGRINLTKAIPRAINARNYAVTSPPVVCRDVVIVGASISDGPLNKEAPRGDIQAFDVRTGKPAWIFHTVPQAGEFGNDTWENDSWKYTGNTNTWTIMSVDEDLGYVYLPTGTPTNDWYGGHRLGNNLFAESLICVEAKTGRRVWHFQTVHHGVWDYDLPAAPVLCDITVNGREIRAVAQISKTGFCFVFDRVTGEPVWPIEERPVPQSTVPGERTSPTQPFPTKPAPYETQGATVDNLIDFSPALRAEAINILNQYDHGPLFTPPTEKGTINLPGWGGGANWWGAAFDPETSILYIPSINSPIVLRLTRPNPTRSNFQYAGQVSGAPAGPRGLPLFKPPYGRITAIDLNKGDHVWQIPHGNGPRQQVNQILANGKDVGPLGGGGGGPLLTRTLLFVGQGGGAGVGASHVMRAFDKATGKVIAEIGLGARPHGTPMTYLAGGKQYIVVATYDGRLTALSLP